MKQKLLLSVLIIFAYSLTPYALRLATAQVPQGFNYQAIARNSTGDALVNTDLEVYIGILKDTVPDDYLWEEKHLVRTNAFGLFSIVVGDTLAVNTDGSAASFSEIDWVSDPLFIRTKVYHNSTMHDMGAVKLQSVPYAFIAGDLAGSLKKLVVTDTTASDTSALFEVRNRKGQTVFAVYNEGVRIYVDDGTTTKGAKGGFAIGSISETKGVLQDFFIVNSDSIRAYVDTDTTKGAKGGFAIGGFDPAKAGREEFLRVTRDSTRVYLNDTGTKGAKGGFAIGGFDPAKGEMQDFLTISTDSIRMYIDDGAKKGAKGGFAIGGFDEAKGGNKNFLNVATSATDTINPSQNRILWYPLKNAFLVGKVLIEKPDSVGQNSFSAGYESKPKGDYSQAMGFKARTEGEGSTAIGNYAFAKGSNSFALGDSAFVLADDAYAIGAGTLVTGRGSFAIGSKDKLFGDNFELSTSARGQLSMAMGLDADAEGLESFASGIGVKAEGDYSVAMGRSSTASGDFSMALQGNASGTGSITIGGGSATALNSISIGLGTSSGSGSAVIGNGTADNYYSIALGYSAYASGKHSFAVGSGSTAQPYGSFVIGSYNKISGNKESIIDTDPVFIIGNGTYITPSNAFTVLRNGKTAVGHDAPAQMLDVNGQVKIRGGSPGAGKLLTSDADGDATWENPAVHTHSTSDITSGTLTVTRGGIGDSDLALNKVLVGNGTSAVLQPTYLHWDETNSRLGIADVSPSYNLDIAGTAQVTQSVWLASSSGNVGIGTTAASTRLRVNGNLAVGTYNAATSNGLAVSGSVGIGTSSPSSQLHVENSTGGVKVLLDGASGNSSVEFTKDGVYVGAFGANLTDNYLFIYQGNNISFKSGMVGIGNINPGQKLDITGGNGRVESAYSWLTNSDMRFKDNITTLTGSLGKILNLRGVRFDLKEDNNHVQGSGKYIGFIAQELETMFPEFVVTGPDGYKSVAYDKMSAVLVEAVKEQQNIIETQKNQILKQETELETLKNRINKIEEMLVKSIDKNP